MTEFGPSERAGTARWFAELSLTRHETAIYCHSFLHVLCQAAAMKMLSKARPRPSIQLCDRLGLTVTVCHYPTGCSKWNPVERRLFGSISLNWAGQPLRTWDTLLAYIRGTTTTTGLKVDAFRHDGCYETGRSVAQQDIDALNLERHSVCPNWNYTLRPHTQGTVEDAQEREVVS